MATEYSAEWVKVPDGNGGQKKVWIRDSKARRDLDATKTDVGNLQTDVSAIQSQINGVRMTSLKKSASSTTDTFTSPAGGARHLIVSLDSNGARVGMWAIWSTGANAVGYKEFINATGMTPSTSGATFIITHTSATPLYLDITTSAAFLALS